MQNSPDDPRAAPDSDIANLKDSLPAILRTWQEICQARPWHVAPDRFGVDTLAEVVRAVLDVALAAQGDDSAYERLVRVSVAHGDQRRAQDVGDDAVLREYHSLREAIWQYMEGSNLPSSTVLPQILRIDVAVSVATTAALRGYHRADFEPGSSWEPQLLRHIRAASRQLTSGLDRAAGDPPA